MYNLLIFLQFILSIGIFGLCGLFITSYLRPREIKTRPFYLFTAPMFGLITLPTVVAFFYQFGLPFVYAAVLAVVILSAFSLWRWPFIIKAGLLPPRWQGLALVCLVLVSSFCLIASGPIKHHEPVIELIDGSDVLGYATDADWLLNHTAAQLPRKTDGYELIPYQNLRHDQRYSAFIYLALNDLLNQHSSLFTFHLACAIAIGIAMLALAALTSSNIMIFLLVSIGVMISALFDYSHAGFLGKILGFPAVLTLGYTYLDVSQRLNKERLALLCWLALGASALHSFATAMVAISTLAFGAFIYAMVRAAQTGHWRETIMAEMQCLWSFLPAFVVMFASTGGFSVLLGNGDFDWQGFPIGLNIPFVIDIRRLFLVTLDLDFTGGAVTYADHTSLAVLGLIFGAIALTLALACLAFWQKQRQAFALLFGPLIFLLASIAFRPWGVFQLSGFFYLSGLLGAASLLSNLRWQAQQFVARVIFVAVACLTLASLSLRAPRFMALINRYLLTPNILTMTEQEFASLRQVIGKEAVLVDVEGTYLVQPLIVVFGREHLGLQFNEKSWVMKGWGLDLPTYAEPAKLRIVAANHPIENWQTLYQGQNYWLQKQP